MLVSTSHNFVFIHIAKNGGTTLRGLLQEHSIGASRRSHWGDFKVALPFRENPENITFPPHVNARTIRRKLGFKFYEAAFSFAFVRNPYDRAVSRFESVRQNPVHHCHKQFCKMSFADFIRDEKHRNLFKSRTQLSEISDSSGKIIVSKVYRFEEYARGVADICQRIGLTPPAALKTANPSQRQDYQTYFTPETRKLFDKIYHGDLDAFNYRF